MRAAGTHSTRTTWTGPATCCSSHRRSSRPTRLPTPTRTFQTTLQNAYPNLTGGKDSTSGLAKIFKRANALQRILRAAYSWITSQDDLIGNAIEDSVVNEYHTGANWIVRGESNVTKGWLKLQMR